MSAMGHDAPREALATMRRRQGALPSVLRTAAARLRSPGAPPPRSLVEALTSHQAEFTELSAWLSSTAGASDGREGPESLDQLEARLARHELCSRVRPVLARAKSIRACDHGAEGAAAILRSEADRLERLLEAPGAPTANAELCDVAEGRHPVCLAVRLVADGRELSDDAWSEVHQLVQSSLGPSFAAAAARGRLTVAAQSASSG